MKKRHSTITIVAAGIVLFVLLLSGCIQIDVAEKDIFDVKRSISPDYFENTQYHFQEVFFQTEDNINLEGWFITQPNAHRTVLYCGGNGFVISASNVIITSIIEQGVNLFVFNYRGYGTNPGVPTVEGVLADGAAAYDYLVKSLNILPQDIVIHGHSLGSLVAGALVNMKSVAGLVLESPITDAKDYSSRVLPWFIKPFVSINLDPVLHEYSNLDELSKFKHPLLIIVGDEDNVTPKSMAEELYNIAQSSKKRIEVLSGGGHNDLPERDDYRTVLYEFYNSTF